MTDTTTLIQRLRLMSPDLIGGEAADALEQQAAELDALKRDIESLLPDLTAANVDIEQQAAQIAEKDAEIARLHKALDSAYAQAMENGATANALRADAEQMRSALNFIAERMCSDWSQRCQAMVNTARAALRQEQPT